MQRIFVQKDYYEDFSDRFVERTRRLKVSDKMDESTDMGPLISDAATLKVGQYVQDAVAHGAKILTGGEGVAHAIFEMTEPKTYCFNL